MSEGMVQEASTQAASVPTTPDITPNQTSNDQQSTHRTFTQSELSHIVSRERNAAVEAYKKRTADEYQPQQTYADTQFDENKYRQMASDAAEKAIKAKEEEAQRIATLSQVNKIVDEFKTKLEAGKGKYQDFDAKVTPDFLQSIPHVVQATYSMDNVADIMYDLRNNPEKLGNIYNLMAINPQLATERLTQLSQSLKDNENANRARMPNEPLSKLNPSTHGMGLSDTQWSVAKARAKYKV